MAILADHLEVPSKTDCLTAFMWPAWLLSSTPNTDLSLSQFIITRYTHTEWSNPGEVPENLKKPREYKMDRTKSRPIKVWIKYDFG